MFIACFLDCLHNARVHVFFASADHNYAQKFSFNKECQRLSVSLTPRKKWLKTLCNRQRVTITRLRQRLEKHKSGNKPTRQVPNATCKPLQQFIKSQIKLSQTSKFGRRYNVSDKRFALSLFYASPKAYKVCSKLFCLPSVSMLKVWLRRISLTTGFSDNVFQMLHRKAEVMTEMNRICCLVLDEISLKCGFKYSKQEDKVMGFEDFGCGVDTGKVANHALVLMARGLFDRWKQPIAYFFVCNTTPAKKLHELVTECIKKLRIAGFTVVSVVCDQGATNRQMFDTFGVTADVPYVDVDGDIVHFMYDPPHLVKCLRNNFMKYDLMFNGHRVKWQHVLDFYTRDSKQKLKLAPKLTDKHFNLPPFAAMRVRLATQIFSHSVASGIYTHVSLGVLPPDAEYTAEFVEMVDGLFDCFNTGNLSNAKQLRRALRVSSPHWDHLNKCKSAFSTVKVLGCKSKVPCISAVVLSINSLTHLFSTLHAKFNISFLLPNRLNQDCLENHFATIRGRGGFRDSPTPDAFAATFRQVLVQHLISPPKGANCADDMTEFLLRLQDVSRTQRKLSADCTIMPSVCSPLSNLPLVVSDADVAELEVSSLTYVAGYVCKVVTKEHACESCNNMLLSECQAKKDLPVFFQHKVYDHCIASSLCIPSQLTLDVVQKCQTVFHNAFEELKQKQGIFGNLFRMCEAELGKMTQIAELSDCRADSIVKIVALFLRVLLYHNIKVMNGLMSSKAVGKRNKKAQKVLHT